MTETPDFNTLSESEKRIVAERLLTIKESGWKPFWCPVADCDGMPHWAIDKDGNSFFVSETEVQGPLGQPVGERVYESADGEWYAIEDGEEPDEGDVCMGRPILDPVWAHNHAREDQRLLPWNEKWTLFIMSGRGSGKTRTGVEFVTLCARKGLDGAILGRRGTELINTHVAEIIAHAHPEVIVRRVSTYANRANLSKDFLATLEREYEGTRMGRQELHGEVLRDVEG